MRSAAPNIFCYYKVICNTWLLAPLQQSISLSSAHTEIRTSSVCVFLRALVTAANQAQDAITGGRGSRGLGDARTAGCCHGAPGQHCGGGCAEAVTLRRVGLGRTRGAARGGAARAAGVCAGALPPCAALPAPRPPPLQPGAPAARPSSCLALQRLEESFLADRKQSYHSSTRCQTLVYMTLMCSSHIVGHDILYT